MNNRNLIIASVIAFLGALFFVAYQKKIIIFNCGGYHSIPATAIEKKQITFFFFTPDKAYTETQLMVLDQYHDRTLLLILNRWLEIALEEKLVPQKVIVQDTALNQDFTDLYLSFDKVPWAAYAPTKVKWFILEGILHTIKNLGFAITKVYFLVNHKPIEDYHLNFSRAWPINGFMQNA